MRERYRKRYTEDMTRFVILALVLFVSVGCGNQVEQNVPATNKMDSATYVRPAAEKIGSTTMKEFSVAAGLKPYPSSETATGEKFTHGDGVTKHVITFPTGDSLDKIAAFYRAEGMDIKNPALPIGATKLGAQVMISISANEPKGNIVKITGLVSNKKSP
jgi:hypothetical protein